MKDFDILKTKKVLYVEDDKVIFESTLCLIQLFFSKILSANDGQTALEYIKKEEFDIAILDIRLPFINGLELALKIKEKNPQIIIIMMSNYTEFKDLRTSIQLQVFDYLVKPFKFNDFKELMQRCVNIFKQEERIEHIEGGLFYNYTSKKLIEDSNTIDLTKNETTLIEYFLKNRGKTLTYNEISQSVYHWENDSLSLSGIKNIIFRLRRKIKTPFIKNMVGVGYCVK